MTRPAKTTRQREGAPPRIAYTLREVANSLGLSLRQVQRLAASGELPSATIGGRRIVPVEDFEELRATLRRKSQAAS